MRTLPIYKCASSRVRNVAATTIKTQYIDHRRTQVVGGIRPHLTAHRAAHPASKPVNARSL